MSQTLLKIVADFDVQLASGVAIGDTTATLSSATDDDSVSLPSGLYGFTIDKGQSNKEYIICQLSGTSLTSIQSISRQGVATSGFARAHRRGAKVTITDWAILSRILNNLDGTTGLNASSPIGYDGAPASLTGNQFATVNYVLSVVSGGTVTFDRQVVSNQTSGESLTANDIVYFKEADAKWYKADANLITPSSQLKLGVALSTVAIDSTVQIAISGPVSGFTGLTAGSKYYLSDTAGAISTTKGSNTIFIGWALSTTTILLDTTDKVLPMGSLSTTVNPENILIEDNASAASTDQTQTTQNGTVEVGEANTTTKKNKLAQSFIPSRTKLRSVSLYKSADSGTFTGTVTISIQADTSGSPSGTALVTKTFTNIEWLVLSTGENEIEFSSEYSLTIGATYWIVIETSTSDTTNHPNFGTNTAGGYTKGSVKYNNTTDGWASISTIDLYFKTNEGIANQVVKTNSSGKIKSNFYSISEMPKPAFSQTIGLDPTVYGIASGGEYCFGTNTTGSVFYLMVASSGHLGRFERDSLTGQYLLTHSIRPTFGPGGGDTGAIIEIGSYIYIFANDNTNIKSSRFLAADLTGETTMTVPTVACTTHTNAWTDGVYAYVVSAQSNTTVRKWSVSGTTFTEVSTDTCLNPVSQTQMFDGSYWYANAWGSTAAAPGPSVSIKKYATTSHSSIVSTTTKNSPVLSDIMLGTLLVNIDTTRMYIGFLYRIYDETGYTATGLSLVPITKP